MMESTGLQKFVTDIVEYAVANRDYLASPRRTKSTAFHTVPDYQASERTAIRFHKCAVLPQVVAFERGIDEVISTVVKNRADQGIEYSPATGWFTLWQR